MSELMSYLWNCLVYPRTPAEYIQARIETITNSSFNFNYGIHYPRFLLIFTIVTTYSVACPIIAPCGQFFSSFGLIFN